MTGKPWPAPDVPSSGTGGNRRLAVIAAAYGAVSLLLAIDPVYPADWLLENLLVFPFVALFLVLHAVGSHYTYSEVPIGDWARDAFGLSRNHFDRVVHLSFGLLLGYPALEVLVRATGGRGAVSYWLTVAVALAFSTLYEMIEWLVGTQGDQWDSQKDTALAGLGAVISMVLTAVAARGRGASG